MAHVRNVTTEITPKSERFPEHFRYIPQPVRFLSGSRYVRYRYHARYARAPRRQEITRIPSRKIPAWTENALRRRRGSPRVFTTWVRRDIIAPLETTVSRRAALRLPKQPLYRLNLNARSLACSFSRSSCITRNGTSNPRAARVPYRKNVAKLRKPSTTAYETA